MASQWWSASMLLASLMSLYWMTSSAQPHVPLTGDLSPPDKVPRALRPRTREEVQASTQLVKDALTVAKDIFQLDAVKDAFDIIKRFSKCASLVPGIGGLVSSVISVALAFIPQEDPVLKAVKEGFAEVNRKLDSLSIQISELATDVEWFNYISIYSQDERHILNAWRRFSEFTEGIELLYSEKDKQRLAQIFISYYENTGAETGMINLYHYLTVTHTSLTVNINDLLVRKLKCNIGQIGKYNLYLNSLLWKGMVVNQFYWKLIFNKTNEEAKHTQVIKEVTEAQISTIEYCLDRSEEYMKNDVIETTKALSQKDNQAIAVRVKKILDQKYNWYRWMVLVYKKSNEDKILLYNMIKIPVGDIIVAVDYAAEGPVEWTNEIKQGADKCFKDKDCMLLKTLPECKFTVPYSRHPTSYQNLPFADYAKIVYAARGDDYKVEPEPFHKVDCLKSQVFIHYSRKLPVCTNIKCQNGKCERLLNSNESWCKCHDGYYGDLCEKKMMF
uniref:EGF-like domain-containing protein n=1 Tax=Amphilophus citrinellus TaxID=61819 RepID=A0A3Q0RNN0_AMPCI